MAQHQPIRVVVEHKKAGSGCGTVFLVLVLIARAVGSFMRTSVSETNRAEQELRKGMR